MAERHLIPDLGAKIELLLKSDKYEIRKKVDLAYQLDIGEDYLSRLISGSRVLPERHFLRLCEIFQLKQKDWFVGLETFGKRLDFTRNQIAHIKGSPLPGIDFASRIKDKHFVEDIFNLIRGYWESYYYSVGKTDRPAVCRDLFIVRNISEDDIIECEIHDIAPFVYLGWCFPIKNHLFIILEKDKIFNEIIVYSTNLPDRNPPKLYGIILCDSSGTETTNSIPCAAKVFFRYIGSSEDEIRRSLKISKKEKSVEDYLKRKIPKYLFPEEETDPEIKTILSDISNTIEHGAIPSALRMQK